MRPSLMLIFAAGSDRFYMNIEDMIGYKPVFFIKWCWMILTPGICAVSLTEQTIHISCHKTSDNSWAASVHQMITA